MLRNFAAFITVALALGACAMGGPDEWVGEEWSELDEVPVAPEVLWAGPGGITGGHIAGTLGPYAGFSEVAYRQTLFSDAFISDVTLHAGSGFWVMTRLSIEGGLTHPALVPGATFDVDHDARDVRTGVYLSVLGCAGQAEGVFDFDEAAENVTVQIEAGPTPNQRVLRFTAVFPDGATVEGSFGYVVL